tara:strand:- start:12752 stop:13621 length:870 start_codon:yes stop_codon:yes gene_type:complete
VKLPVLVSFAHSEEFALTVSEMAGAWSLMLDSGAFTNWSTGKEVVKLDAYRAFLLRHGRLFARYLNLDVIGDPVASRRNFDALRDAGLSPVPVFQRGGAAQELRRMVREAGFVCIGGISRNPQAQAEQAYMRQTLSIVRQEGGSAHLLGVTGLSSLRALRPASCDSSTWSVADRFGRADLWSGYAFLPVKRKALKPTLARGRALRSFGVTWEELRDPEAWKTKKRSDGTVATGAARMLCARSWMRYSRTLARQGTALYLATQKMFYNHESLLAAWEKEKHRWTKQPSRT